MVGARVHRQMNICKPAQIHFSEKIPDQMHVVTSYVQVLKGREQHTTQSLDGELRKRIICLVMKGSDRGGRNVPKHIRDTIQGLRGAGYAEFASLESGIAASANVLDSFQENASFSRGKIDVEAQEFDPPYEMKPSPADVRQGHELPGNCLSCGRPSDGDEQVFQYIGRKVQECIICSF